MIGQGGVIKRMTQRLPRSPNQAAMRGALGCLYIGGTGCLADAWLVSLCRGIVIDYDKNDGDCRLIEGAPGDACRRCIGLGQAMPQANDPFDSGVTFPRRAQAILDL
jgi:hypothetical protein